MSDTATYCAGHWLALKGDQCWALVQLGPGDPRVTGVQAALADPHPVDAIAGLLSADGPRAPGFALVGREGPRVRYAVRSPAKVTAVVNEVPVFIDGIDVAGRWADGHFAAVPERAELANGAWGGMEEDQPLVDTAHARSLDVVFDPNFYVQVQQHVDSTMAPPLDHTIRRSDLAAAPPPAAPPPAMPSAPSFQSPPPSPVPPPPVAPPQPAPESKKGIIDGLPWRKKGAKKPDPNAWGPPDRQPSPPPATPPAPRPTAPPPPMPAPAPAPSPTPPNDMATRVRDVATPTPVPPAGGPTVWAVYCPQGHASPPYSPTCRICRMALPPHQQPVSVPRPALGQLKLGDGRVVILDRGAVFGRSPRADASGNTGAGGVPPHLVKVMLPDISRLHTEVRLEEWQVLVRDLGSANGTYLTLPGGRPQQMRPMEEYALEPGAVVSLAGSINLTYEVLG
ncbi:FHA domain-containing protein [Nocardioides sp. NPDC127514]|uniref:FHA domain-containing protein n=2 Tax=unclassified Nocardioides TaxID=2615069 RepID=UPI0013597870